MKGQVCAPRGLQCRYRHQQDAEKRLIGAQGRTCNYFSNVFANLLQQGMETKAQWQGIGKMERWKVLRRGLKKRREEVYSGPLGSREVYVSGSVRKPIRVQKYFTAAVTESGHDTVKDDIFRIF